MCCCRGSSGCQSRRRSRCWSGSRRRSDLPFTQALRAMQSYTPKFLMSFLLVFMISITMALSSSFDFELQYAVHDIVLGLSSHILGAVHTHTHTPFLRVSTFPQGNRHRQTLLCSNVSSSFLFFVVGTKPPFCRVLTWCEFTCTSHETCGPLPPAAPC